MDTVEQAPPSLTAQVKRLVKSSRNQQDVGAALCALGSDAILLLCSTVQAEGKRRKRLRWFFTTLNLIGPLINLILISLIPREAREPYQMLVWGVAGVGALGNVWLVWRGGHATKMLAHLDDMRVIGPLLDALTANYTDVTLKATIRLSLLRLLPRLQASDAACLLPRHIAALNREIDFCRAWKWGMPAEVAYALVVFKALEQVGDETSVASVTKVFETTQNAQTREAALACLPFLQARAAMGKHTLLRAASQEAENLLLPAQATQIAEPGVLLRPASG